MVSVSGGSGVALAGAVVGEGICVLLGASVGRVVGGSTSALAGCVLGAMAIAGAGFLGPFTIATGTEQTVQRASNPTQNMTAVARGVLC